MQINYIVNPSMASSFVINVLEVLQILVSIEGKVSRVCEATVWFATPIKGGTIRTYPLNRLVV